MWRWLMLLLLLAGGPATRPSALEEARALASRGEHGKAVEKYHEALAAGERPEAHAGLAASLLALGKIQEAAEEIDRAIQARPREAGYWMVAGRVAIARGDWDGAEQCYGKADDAAPQQAGEIWMDLASALAMEKDAKLNGRIERALKRAASANPPNRSALFTLGQSCVKAGDQKGKAYLERYLELESALPEEKRDAQKMQLARQMIRALEILKSLGQEK